jgi:hypothetical protein
VTTPDAQGTTLPRQLRLLVVDDHEVVRQGLVALLDRRPGFQVVAEAGTVARRIWHRGVPGDQGGATRDPRRDVDVLPR